MGVLRCISAYATDIQDAEGDAKDLWSAVCREIFTFTTSSPCFFQAGLQLLLDLLPLPFPVATVKSLSAAEREAVSSMGYSV